MFTFTQIFIIISFFLSLNSMWQMNGVILFSTHYYFTVIYFHSHTHHKWDLLQYYISMAWCKTMVSPLLMQWGYHSLALSHWYNVDDMITSSHNILSKDPCFVTLQSLVALVSASARGDLYSSASQSGARGNQFPRTPTHLPCSLWARGVIKWAS